MSARWSELRTGRVTREAPCRQRICVWAQFSFVVSLPVLGFHCQCTVSIDMISEDMPPIFHQTLTHPNTKTLVSWVQEGDPRKPIVISSGKDAFGVDGLETWCFCFADHLIYTFVTTVEQVHCSVPVMSRLSIHPFKNFTLRSTMHDWAWIYGRPQGRSELMQSRGSNQSSVTCSSLSVHFPLLLSLTSSCQ